MAACLESTSVNSEQAQNPTGIVTGLVTDIETKVHADSIKVSDLVTDIKTSRIVTDIKTSRIVTAIEVSDLVSSDIVTDIKTSKGDKAKPACVGVPSPSRRRLQPSLQAWAASRKICAPESGGTADNSTPDELITPRGALNGSLKAQGVVESTVAVGPVLRTAMRSHSRDTTPNSTPIREKFPSTPRSSQDVWQSEQTASNHHVARLTASRLRSTSRDEQKQRTPAPSPARSASSDTSKTSQRSASSRLSKRSASARHLHKTTEELELMNVERARYELRQRMRQNATNYKKRNIEPQLMAGKGVEFKPTTPSGPHLNTAERAQSRSKSEDRVHSNDHARSERGAHPIPREEAAIRRHLERASATYVPPNPFQRNGFKCEGSAKSADSGFSVPEVVDPDKTGTAEERAMRAVVLAQAAMEKGAMERARVCIFKGPKSSSTSTAVATTSEDTVVQQGAIIAAPQGSDAES